MLTVKGFLPVFKTVDFIIFATRYNHSQFSIKVTTFIKLQRPVKVYNV